MRIQARDLPDLVQTSPLAGGRHAAGRSLLVLLPERQQALRGGASDHAGDADGHLPERGRGNAAQPPRADADLAPEVEIAPRVRSLGLEVFYRSHRIAAQRADLH